jgi:hypothetical protein
MAADQGPTLPVLKDVIARLTAPGSGRESGTTIEEIAAEFRSVARHRGSAAALRDRIAMLLLHPTAMFRQTRRPDGALAFLNVAPAPVDPIFGDLPAPLFAEPFPRPIPTPVPDLKSEVQRLEARKAELLREEQHLLLCQQLLLQNPARVQEETERLTSVLLNMRDVQGIIDYKVKEVLEFMRLHGPDPD